MDGCEEGTKKEWENGVGQRAGVDKTPLNVPFHFDF